MSTEELSYLELQTKAKDLNLPVKPNASKVSLVEAINAEEARRATLPQDPPPVQTAPPTVAEQNQEKNPGVPVVSHDQFVELLKRLERKDQVIEKLMAQQATHVNDGMSPMEAQTYATKQLVKELRGDTTPEGFMRSGMAPGPEDILDQEAIFWCRSLNWRMRELQIGSRSEALPFGMKDVYFQMTIPPIAVRHPGSPIPSVVTICQFRTKNKSLAEKLRLDARYNSVFFEDTKLFLGPPKPSEFHLARQKHIGMLRSKPEVSYVFAEAAKENLSYTQHSSVEHLISQIADIRAERDVTQQIGGLMDADLRRRKETSLAANAAVHGTPVQMPMT